PVFSRWKRARNKKAHAPPAPRFSVHISRSCTRAIWALPSNIFCSPKAFRPNLGSPASDTPATRSVRSDDKRHQQRSIRVPRVSCFGLQGPREQKNTRGTRMLRCRTCNQLLQNDKNEE